jgi:phage tail-like protein
MMRAKEPTFWLLHGRNGWHPSGDRRDTPTLHGIGVGERSGIRLAADKAGALGLRSADGSLGGLVLPRGMALADDGVLYLLAPEEAPNAGATEHRPFQIKRFDPIERDFTALPYVGGAGSEPRQFRAPRNIAIAGRNMYVADSGNRRVQVFDLDSLALRHVWARAWFPADIVAHGGAAYMLDWRRGRVYRHRPGSDRLELVLNPPQAAHRWSRVIVDRAGRIYLLNARRGRLERYLGAGRPLETYREPGDIRDRFDAPPLRMDHQRRFCVPERLADPCDRGAPTGPALETPLALCPPRRQPPDAPWWFTAGALAGAGALALALKRARDPLSRYLRGSFSIETRRLIDAFSGGTPPDELAEALRAELNRLIQDRDLYGERRFACVVLSEEIKQLIDRGPRGQERSRLNRRLLEAAYPAAFATAQPPRERLIFDRWGRHTEPKPDEPAGPRLYAMSGTWTSGALDSQLYRCQWHRVELELLDLPPGTQVVIRTYTDDQATNIAGDRDWLWKTCYTIQGPVQSDDPRLRPELNHQFLVQSREGQYLWLRIDLVGDGYATPAVGALRVHYPRESYLNYLPAVYAADDESRWFLERFLSVFQTDWDALEQRIDEIAQYFDPAAVPEGKPLAYLASWLALPLEGGWSEPQKRRLLAAMPRIASKRCTLAGLQEYLRVYLQNIRGDAPKHASEAAPPDVPGYPLIVEGFRERQHLLLADWGGAALGRGLPPLWGPAQVGRLQLDVFARAGEVRLVSVGDPQRDLFHEYAHRFRVYVPAAWVRSADQERLVRRAIEAEKPAHTRYDLCLVEPRYRVGLQSTVGVDTIIGAYPRARLACHHDSDAPPSQATRGILGYDTVLGGARAGTGGLALRPHTRIGIDTRLT